MDLFLALSFTIILNLAVIIFLIRYINDLKVPTKSINDLHINKQGRTKVLFIYPHPDDETMASGGLINSMVNNKNFEVFVVSTSRGEKGNELRKDLSEEQLGDLRESEFGKSMQALSVQNFEIWDFPDGAHTQEIENLKQEVKSLIEEYQFDMVVTYEKHGLYGHPDHIALSKIVTELNSEINFKALYVTLPNKILEKISLPKSIQLGDKTINLSIDKIANPTFKINISKSIFRKFLAARKYKSQNLGQGKPLAAVVGFMVWEYYSEFPISPIDPISNRVNI